MSAEALALNVSTRELITDQARNCVNTFLQSSVLHTKLWGRKKIFPGGTQIRTGIQYRPPLGGGHLQGQPFDNVTVDTKQKMMHDMKLMEITVAFDKINSWVFNRGPEALYDEVKRLIFEGFETGGKFAEVGLYLPGTGASYAANVNGLPEICDDGTTGDWQGTTYTSYGELSRTDGSAWNAAVKGQTTDINAAISKRQLAKTHTDTWIDNKPPDIGVTTPDTVVYIEDRFQDQQRFVTETNPDLGFPALKYHGTPLVPSRYVPGNFISGMTMTGKEPISATYVNITSKRSGTELATYPTVLASDGTACENLIWMNTDYIDEWVGQHPVMRLGFDDFIPSPNNDMLVGRIRLAWQVVAYDPRRLHWVKRIKI